MTPAPPEADHQDGLDRRTRAQRLLDGLVGACKTALAAATLPATGGLRPQVMVTINYRDLLNRLETRTAQDPRGTQPGSGTFTHTGPISPAIIRKIACDADIIPVLLGSNSRVLDIGRTTRIFPPHTSIPSKNPGKTTTTKHDAVRGYPAKPSAEVGS
ncbi:DUF222 domain-containing protein [Arthrobacter sp. 2MCAF14]|uniref:DUF222 domain-containing protein n=1 Tax=Arthrobacter sp. 2MCAF14 TaxID=3232982 RepID=UPI003F935B11